MAKPGPLLIKLVRKLNAGSFLYEKDLSNQQSETQCNQFVPEKTTTTRRSTCLPKTIRRQADGIYINIQP